MCAPCTSVVSHQLYKVHTRSRKKRVQIFLLALFSQLGGLIAPFSIFPDSYNPGDRFGKRHPTPYSSASALANFLKPRYGGKIANKFGFAGPKTHLAGRTLQRSFPEQRGGAGAGCLPSWDSRGARRARGRGGGASQAARKLPFQPRDGAVPRPEPAQIRARLGVCSTRSRRGWTSGRPGGSGDLARGARRGHSSARARWGALSAEKSPADGILAGLRGVSAAPGGPPDRSYGNDFDAQHPCRPAPGDSDPGSGWGGRIPEKTSKGTKVVTFWLPEIARQT